MAGGDALLELALPSGVRVHFPAGTGSGWLTDRHDPRHLLFAYYAIRGTSLLFLPHALGRDGAGLHAFTLLYGLDWVATVPPTARLANDAFGDEDGPIVFGWLFEAHQVGASLAALGAGVARTRLGDYRATFLMAGILCVAAAAMALRIRRSSRSGRERYCDPCRRRSESSPPPHRAPSGRRSPEANPGPGT